MAYRVYLGFNPEEVNRGRRSGFGTWRVLESHYTYVRNPAVWVIGTPPCLAVVSNRRYRKGVLINPKRVAIDYVRGCHAGI